VELAERNECSINGIEWNINVVTQPYLFKNKKIKNLKEKKQNLVELL